LGWFFYCQRFFEEKYIFFKTNVSDAAEITIRSSYNFWVDYFVSGPVGAESIDIVMYEDDSVQMTPAIVDFVTWTNNGPNPDGYACDLGSSFSIVTPSTGKSSIPGTKFFPHIDENRFFSFQFRH
jgi:hypothetical protein